MLLLPAIFLFIITNIMMCRERLVVVVEDEGCLSESIFTFEYVQLIRINIYLRDNGNTCYSPSSNSFKLASNSFILLINCTLYMGCVTTSVTTVKSAHVSNTVLVDGVQ